MPNAKADIAIEVLPRVGMKLYACNSEGYIHVAIITKLTEKMMCVDDARDYENNKKHGVRGCAGGAFGYRRQIPIEEFKDFDLNETGALLRFAQRTEQEVLRLAEKANERLSLARDARKKAGVKDPLAPRHTPKPWTLNQYGYVGTAGGIICIMFKDDGRVPMSNRLSKEEQEANGLLIKHAPDLLEACEGMFEAHESYSNEFNPGKKIRAVADWGLINEKFMAARRAISLAKGLYTVQHEPVTLPAATKGEPMCERCGADIIKGLCDDQTCPFSKHEQNCPAGWVGHPEHPQTGLQCTCKPKKKKSK